LSLSEVIEHIQQAFAEGKSLPQLSRRENFMPLAANFTAQSAIHPPQADFTYTGGVLWSSGIFLTKTAPLWA
jgi:hypothetical protein